MLLLPLLLLMLKLMLNTQPNSTISDTGKHTIHNNLTFSSQCKYVDTAAPAAVADAKAVAKTQTNSAISDTTNHTIDDSITLSITLSLITI
eukprot:14991170-Heterocapsa_arctica.AAC.1